MNKLFLLLWILPLYGMDNDQRWEELKPRSKEVLEARKLTREKALECLICKNTADDTKKSKLCSSCLDRVARYNDYLESLEKECFE